MDRKEPLVHEPDPTDRPSEDYDVVPLHNESQIDRMNDRQKAKVGRFYELLASAMPLEGRDYRLEFSPAADDKVGVKVVGLNAFGEAFSAQVMDYWRRFGYKS